MRISLLKEVIAKDAHEKWVVQSKNLSKTLKIAKDRLMFCIRYIPHKYKEGIGNFARGIQNRLGRWESECWRPYEDLSKEMQDLDLKEAEITYKLIEPFMFKDEFSKQDLRDVAWKFFEFGYNQSFKEIKPKDNTLRSKFEKRYMIKEKRLE